MNVHDDAALMDMAIPVRNALLDDLAAEADHEAYLLSEVEAERRNELALAFPGDGMYAGSEEEARDRWLDSLNEGW